MQALGLVPAGSTPTTGPLTHYEESVVLRRDEPRQPKVLGGHTRHQVAVLGSVGLALHGNLIDVMSIMVPPVRGAPARDRAHHTQTAIPR